LIPLISVILSLEFSLPQLRLKLHPFSIARQDLFTIARGARKRLATPNYLSTTLAKDLIIF